MREHFFFYATLAAFVACLVFCVCAIECFALGQWGHGAWYFGALFVSATLGDELLHRL